MISIHALREEGDRSWQTTPANRCRFLSTPSARRATLKCPIGITWTPYFYPRPPRGGRRGGAFNLLCTRYFYPRPPRGGRHKILDKDTSQDTISIHALREEGDRAAIFKATTESIQISIHALREEGDRFGVKLAQLHKYFYPRPPRGGRLPLPGNGSRDKRISIHALREEGDTFHLFCGTLVLISIHALREEGDRPSKKPPPGG